MKSIDVDRLFSLFPLEDRLNKELEIEAEELIILPKYRFTLFKKLINNYGILQSNLEIFLGGIESELDKQDVKEAGVYIFYNRAWMMIKDLDLKDIDTMDGLRESVDKSLVTAFKITLEYFESKEEYEKCKHLKSLLDASHFFLS